MSAEAVDVPVDPRRVFLELRRLFEGPDGVEGPLRAEALSLLDAILEPARDPQRDLKEGLAMLVHCLEGGRWRMGQFFRVLDAHEFLLESIKLLKEPKEDGAGQ